MTETMEKTRRRSQSGHPEDTDNHGHRGDSISRPRRHRGNRRSAGALGRHIRGQPRHVRHRPQRPSAPALAAAEAFAAAGHRSVLELGAGQGRDTLYLARQGLQVTALDIAPGTVEVISAKARAAGLSSMVTVAAHDMREPLPLSDDSIDASYSHMLFCMALTTGELERLALELRRVLRPGG